MSMLCLPNRRVIGLCSRHGLVYANEFSSEYYFQVFEQQF